MQEETAIDINATSSIVVKSALLVEAMRFYKDFHNRQMNHNPPPIDPIKDHELAAIRKENYDLHKNEVAQAEQIIHCILSANRYGGFRIKIDPLE